MSDKKTILEDIEDRIKAATKSGDAAVVAVCRMAKSELTNARIALKSGKKVREMTSDDEIAVIRKMIKRNGDAAKQYQELGMEAQARKELAEQKILEYYLPVQATVDEIRAFVDETMKKLSKPNIGQLVQAVKQKWGSGVDMKEASTVIKEALQK